MCNDVNNSRQIMGCHILSTKLISSSDDSRMLLTFIIVYDLNVIQSSGDCFRLRLIKRPRLCNCILPCIILSCCATQNHFKHFFLSFFIFFFFFLKKKRSSWLSDKTRGRWHHCVPVDFKILGFLNPGTSITGHSRVSPRQLVSRGG